MALLATVAITTVCWVATAYLGPETDRDVLDQVLANGAARRPRLDPHPRGRGSVQRTTQDRGATTSRSRCSGGWPGCTAIWSALFAEGNYLYGRMPQAIFLTGVFIVSGVVLIVIVKRIWASAA